MKSKPKHFDVAIIGGGSAGSATAISLGQFAPSLSIGLVESSHYEKPRIGETLPGAARSILEHLGLMDTFQSNRHRTVFGTASAWGNERVVETDFIFSAGGSSWHLDRSEFDKIMADEAARNGAVVMMGARPVSLALVADLWRLELSNEDCITARFLVDATGDATVARKHGGRFQQLDNLVGIAGFFENSTGDPRLMVEAFDYGWWYTAGLAGNRRIAACMSDADIVRKLNLTDLPVWRGLLRETHHTKKLVAHCEFKGPLKVRSAASRILSPSAGENWIAVGDSASRFDPLSSQGIIKAMRSGIFASYAIGDLLVRDDSSGIKRYCRFIADEFDSYARTRTAFYREEQRWPESDFWNRRHLATAPN